MQLARCNVLMIYPRFSAGSFWNYAITSELLGARYPTIPLGLITLAATSSRAIAPSPQADFQIRASPSPARMAVMTAPSSSTAGRRHHEPPPPPPAVSCGQAHSPFDGASLATSAKTGLIFWGLALGGGAIAPAALAAYRGWHARKRELGRMTPCSPRAHAND